MTYERIPRRGVFFQRFGAREFIDATGWSWALSASLSPAGIEITIGRWQLDILWRADR